MYVETELWENDTKGIGKYREGSMLLESKTVILYNMLKYVTKKFLKFNFKSFKIFDSLILALI